LVLIVFGTFALLYFLPTIVALVRKQPRIKAIVLVNVFAGWTAIGWILAMVWATSTEPDDVAASD